MEKLFTDILFDKRQFFWQFFRHSFTKRILLAVVNYLDFVLWHPGTISNSLEFFLAFLIFFVNKEGPAKKGNRKLRTWRATALIQMIYSAWVISISEKLTQFHFRTLFDYKIFSSRNQGLLPESKFKKKKKRGGFELLCKRRHRSLSQHERYCQYWHELSSLLTPVSGVAQYFVRFVYPRGTKSRVL